MTGPRAVGGAHDAAGKVRALDGRLENELLAALEGHSLADQERCVEVKLLREGLGREAALLVGHGDGGHAGSFRHKKGPGGAWEIMERATGLEPASVSLGS